MTVHYDSDDSYLFLDGKEIYEFKASNKNVNFPSQFCLGNIRKKFGNVDSKEVSLKGILYDFSVDYKIFDKSNILNTQKYLIKKCNIK